ncbi:MAG: cytochrome c biosis protein CcmG, thiol:disulfide interchange protein DsbE [Gammaproteobacteria bacterium]|jgi:cytochrome c biogenesis protein CcmG/thiol:disulfide interchange protein DsbE|nr:cytochrome c biosis protein CcmG, thiol:disulfide interchange protein DsbE [Gammaproteobacteria bacterium]
MWKFLLPFAAFVALAALFAFGLNPKRDIHALPSPLIGKPAPEFALTDVLDANRIVSNSTLKGQVYVLNVWATWCVPCREEHEALLAISQTHLVPLIGLNWKDNRDRSKLWLQQLGNPYQTVAFDGDGRAAIDWGVYGAPETYLVGKGGQVLFKYISPITQQVWNEEFVPRIAAAQQGGA